MERHLVVGDRVRVDPSLSPAVADHVGTVVYVYDTALGLCHVQLDGETAARIFTDALLSLEPPDLTEAPPSVLG